MEAAIQSARATTLHAARLKDHGLPFCREASIAKLVATDNAMKVTTDAVQVLGGYGYTRDFPVERYMREAKVMQIFEGTNQIQRMVIGRSLDRGGAGTLPAPPTVSRAHLAAVGRCGLGCSTRREPVTHSGDSRCACCVALPVVARARARRRWRHRARPPPSRGAAPASDGRRLRPARAARRA